jgi:hypothetical protein
VTFLSRRHFFHPTATANGREWLCWQRPAVVHKHRNRQHEVRLLSWPPMQFALHCEPISLRFLDLSRDFNAKRGTVEQTLIDLVVKVQPKAPEARATA